MKEKKCSSCSDKSVKEYFTEPKQLMALSLGIFMIYASVKEVIYLGKLFFSLFN